MNKGIEIDNGKIIYKPHNKKWIFWLIFAAFIMLSVYITEFEFMDIVNNFDKFVEIIKKMLPPIGNSVELKEYFAFSSEVFPELITTLQMAIVGSFIGAILAFPVAILASNNISSKKVSVIIKFILSLTRTLPVLIYAMILTYIFGLGEFAGVVSIIIFTFGIVTKMLYEIIERTDMGAYEAATASGISTYNAFNLTISPQIMPSFYSISLYVFETNVRSATILGYVGAGGIGQQLKDAMSLRQYSDAGLIILFTILLVVVIDLITQFIRKEMI